MLSKPVATPCLETIFFNCRAIFALQRIDLVSFQYLVITRMPLTEGPINSGFQQCPVIVCTAEFSCNNVQTPEESSSLGPYNGYKQLIPTSQKADKSKHPDCSIQLTAVGRLPAAHTSQVSWRKDTFITLNTLTQHHRNVGWHLLTTREKNSII